MKNRNGISPVVAVALLLVVTVVAVVSFQNWFSGFQSGLNTDVEQRSASASGGVNVEFISDDGTLYVTNLGSSNVSMSTVKVAGIDCSINQNLSPGVNQVDIASCLNGSGTQEVMLVTESGVISESVFLENEVLFINSLTPLWAKSSVGLATSFDEVDTIFLDDSGNVYTFGSGSAAMDFGDGISFSGGIDGVFLSKHNNLGVAQWAINFTTNLYIGGFFEGTSNNIFAYGVAYGNIDFGNGITITPTGNDFFIVEFDSSGIAQQIIKPISSTSDDRIYSAYLDGSDIIHAVGISSSSDIDFGNGYTLTSSSNQDVFIVEYDLSGLSQNLINNSLPVFDSINGILLDNLDNVYISGANWTGPGTLDFGNSVTAIIDPNGGSPFIVKFNNLGVAQWANSIIGSDSDYMDYMAVDSNYNLYAGERLESLTNDFGNGVNLTHHLDADFYLVKYNSLGVAQWVRGATNYAEDYDIVEDIEIDSNDNVYIAGYYRSNNLDFGNGISLTNNAPGEYDFFIARYDSSGNIQSAASTFNNSGTNRERAWAIDINSAGEIIVGGYFNSPLLEFEEGINVSNDGSYDFFIAKYSQN